MDIMFWINIGGFVSSFDNILGCDDTAIRVEDIKNIIIVMNLNEEETNHIRFIFQESC